MKKLVDQVTSLRNNLSKIKIGVPKKLSSYFWREVDARI